MMDTKIKIGIILLVITATMLIGSNGAVKEKESASQLLKSAQGIAYSTYYENFTNGIYQKSNDEVTFINRIADFTELEMISSAIYEVEPITRKLYNLVMQTKCRVKRIFKENTEKQKIDEIIYVYERYSLINGKNGSGIMLDSPIFPMENGKNYLIFVNPIEGYVNRNHYNLVSTVYGIIPIKNDVIITETEGYKGDFKLLPISMFEDSDYVVENIDKTKSDLIGIQITSMLFDLEVQKNRMIPKDYQEERTAIEEKYSALTYSITYKKTLKVIITDALKTYYDMNVVFVDK